MKGLFLICSNLLLPTMVDIVDGVNDGTPPKIYFGFMLVLLYSHEIVLALSKRSWNWTKGAFEDGDGKVDRKALFSSWFILWCIRLFVTGKLYEMFFNQKSFSDDTYYQLILIIFAVIGGLGIQKIKNFIK